MIHLWLLSAGELSRLSTYLFDLNPRSRITLRVMSDNDSGDVNREFGSGVAECLLQMEKVQTIMRRESTRIREANEQRILTLDVGRRYLISMLKPADF